MLLRGLSRLGIGKCSLKAVKFSNKPCFKMTQISVEKREISSEAEVPPSKKQFTEPKLKVKLEHPDAKVPTRGSSKAAGYDLYSCEDTVVPAQGKAIVKTGISIGVPPGTYGRVAPRSGLAVKNFIDVGAGVIDEDYRGLVGVVLFNFSQQEFAVKKGDRIAQLVLEKIMTPEVEEVEVLDETIRGDGGFGSTGKN